MHKLLLVLPILCLPVFSATPGKANAKKSVAKAAVAKPNSKSSAAKSTSAKATAKTATAKTSKSHTAATHTAASRSKAKSKRAPIIPVRTAQQHPSNERYSEIQRALVDRGYLGEANGNWDANSVAALKKFQEDQALHADGKLSALSLTALGLGPRRGAFVVAPQPNTTVAAVE